MMWINVKDQKPEKGQDVFYYFYVFHSVFAGKFNTYKEEYLEGEFADCDVFYCDGGFLGAGEVEWWMPRKEGDARPKPPKGTYLKYLKLSIVVYVRSKVWKLFKMHHYKGA